MIRHLFLRSLLFKCGYRLTPRVELANILGIWYERDPQTITRFFRGHVCVPSRSNFVQEVINIFIHNCRWFSQRLFAIRWKWIQSVDVCISGSWTEFLLETVGLKGRYWPSIQERLRMLNAISVRRSVSVILIWFSASIEPFVGCSIRSMPPSWSRKWEFSEWLGPVLERAWQSTKPYQIYSKFLSTGAGFQSSIEVLFRYVRD